MKYVLIDIDDNQYEFNDGSLIPSSVAGSLSRKGESYSFGQDIIERSYLPGAIKVGEVRLKSRDITFTANVILEEDQDYDDYVNTLLLWMQKAVILRDVTEELEADQKQAKIAALNCSVSHDLGSTKRSGEVTIKFKMLDGFWYDVVETVIEQSVIVGTTNIAVSNDGFLITYPRINFQVGALCATLDLYIDENKEGLQLNDDSFGQPQLDLLEIDNQAGTLTIAEFDRSQNIKEGTGYFPLPIGNSTFVIETPTAGDLTISYCNRYYI